MNIMRQSAKTFLLLLISLFLSYPIGAEAVVIKTGYVILSKDHGNITIGPRMLIPDNYYFLCHYGQGYMEVIFPDGIDRAYLEIKGSNNQTIFYELVDADDNVVDIPLLIDTYEITATTLEGVVFYGLIE